MDWVGREGRGSFRDAGYSSLFSYCTECLGYSEGGAWRRIRAAKCLLKTPVVYGQLKSGQITLCSLSEVAPIVTAENQELVLGAIQGVSKREAQRVAESFGVAKAGKRSTIRARKVSVSAPPVGSSQVAVVEERYSFSFEVTGDVKKLYDEAKELVGHVRPEELFEKLLRDFVNKKKRPARTSIVKVSDSNKSKASITKFSRAIPLKTRREVFERDDCRCTYESSTGKRCSERVGLEIDHIYPFANGGDHSHSNLRLLCPAHNQLHAEKCFGKEFMRNSTSGSKRLRGNPL